jgi:uncharacterized protein YbbC (DUF1343 family)
MPTLKFNIILILLSLFLYCSTHNQQVKTGLDRIHEFESLFEGKRLGIITNHTARNSQGRHISAIFLEKENAEVVAFFGP